MKYLRILLLSIYVILVALLLLTQCNGSELNGRDGKLRIAIKWNESVDIDVHVKEPSGYVISYLNQRNIMTTGWLDRDVTNGGRNSNENVSWLRVPSGSYRVKIHYYSDEGPNDVSVDVLVKAGGDVFYTKTIQLPQPHTAVDVCEIKMPEGIITWIDESSNVGTW